VLAGDESAVPAIGTILRALPETTRATVLVEVADASAELPLDGPAGTEIRWLVAEGDVPGDALVPALTALPVAPDDRVWAAGEAAAVQRVRRHLFDELGHPRRHATVRGYWKHGRASDGDDR
jgi:NADPH-dependent ferric siderophore reductase